jgi:3-phosphoshikimate 1-carboxyvinyltransferase
VNAVVKPSSLKGAIHANASKSSMQRACAAALLSGTEVLLRNPGNSNDDLAALDIIKRLGAEIQENELGVIIRSKGVHPADQSIHCGESGLSIRMFTPIAALSEKEITVTGSGSLITRPMEFFDEVLPLLHVKTTSNNGKLPLHIQGPLIPSTIEIDGSLSSQFLTGLLMAYAAAGANNVSIKVKDLKSKPYIDLTLNVMKQFGLQVPENKSYQEFYFHGNQPPIKNKIDYTVEGDWSGASFLLVAGAIAGPVTVAGLDPFSTQADKAILQALMDAGAVMSVEPSQIIVGPGQMKPFHFNATECPDLFPPVVALASFCNGRTVIEGTSRLTHKESNRALTLQEEFGKMGIKIELQDDLMIVNGGTGLHSAKVHSRHDHRIAMACATAALKADGEVDIEEANAIDKSYPAFFDHLSKLGASVLYN